MMSVNTAKEALQLVNACRNLCARGGFDLDKFLCNDKSVLATIPPELRASPTQQLELTQDSLPIECTLWVQWCVESDTLQFQSYVSTKAMTRRGILSTMSSVYDPLVLICPVVLIGKQILQELVCNGEGWDEPDSDSIRARWRWILDRKELARLQILRCYRNPGGSPVEATAELHCFSDTSNMGYGQCSYLRLHEMDGGGG